MKLFFYSVISVIPCNELLDLLWKYPYRILLFTLALVNSSTKVMGVLTLFFINFYYSLMPGGLDSSHHLWGISFLISAYHKVVPTPLILISIFFFTVIISDYISWVSFWESKILKPFSQLQLKTWIMGEQFSKYMWNLIPKVYKVYSILVIMLDSSPIGWDGMAQPQPLLLLLHQLFYPLRAKLSVW